jgi:localization factor PodJL
MPRSPDADAPLVDEPFGDPEPLAGTRQEASSLPFSGDIDEAAFHFDADLTDKPPRPASSLGSEQQGEAGSTTEEAEPRPSRNAFIEAHRAAQRAAAARSAGPAGLGANSIIGRALARFQGGDKAEATPAEIEPSATHEDEAAPAKPETRKQRKAREKAEAEAARMAEAVVDEEVPVVELDPGETEAEPRPSFLVRNSKRILLGASMVAIAAMAANLVAPRFGEDAARFSNAQADASAGLPAATVTQEADADNAATQLADASSSKLPAKPRIIPLIDSTATGSVDPTGAMRFTPASGPQAMPDAAGVPPVALSQPATEPAGEQDAALPNVGPASPAADAMSPDSAEIAPHATSDAETSAAAAALPEADISSETTASIPSATQSVEDTRASASSQIVSPVKVELPPEGVGPLAMRQAAADGDPRAQFDVAAIFTEGRAVPQDLKAAAIWYERAAAQGFAPAQYRLASLYETGKGVDKDLEQARLWYERAAEAGNRMSMHNLAALYAGGQLGKQDFGSAAQWFEKAAELGMTDSQFNLGMLYARGLGVPQNLETSYKWFSIAAESGDKDAAKARDDVARSLDTATVSKVQADIANWKPDQIDLAANFAPIGTWSTSFDPGDAITDKKVVSRVQVALQRLGFDVGSPDGLMGPKTSDAIKAFEKATGMTEVGAVNPRLLAVLGSQPV